MNKNTLNYIGIGLSLITLGGCANTAQTGGLAGGGIGALAGQAIGHDTESTLIGAGVGAVAGYILGNEVDKANQQNNQAQGNGQTRSRSTTRRVLNPDGTVTETGTEVIDSQKTETGYQGLPNKIGGHRNKN